MRGELHAVTGQLMVYSSPFEWTRSAVLDPPTVVLVLDSEVDPRCVNSVKLLYGGSVMYSRRCWIGFDTKPV